MACSTRPSPSSRTSRSSPLHRWIVSSFRSWYCRESRWPAFTWRSFPTYRSVCAHHSSWPQGFSTRFGWSNFFTGPPSVRGDESLRSGAPLELFQVAVGRLAGLERPEPDPVPAPLARDLRDAHLRPAGGEPGRDPLGLEAILR